MDGFSVSPFVGKCVGISVFIFNVESLIDKLHEDYFNQMAWYKYFYELSTGNKVSKTIYLIVVFCLY